MKWSRRRLVVAIDRPNMTLNHDLDDLTMKKLSALQNAYKHASMSYRLQGITRSVNNTWARNGDDLEMKNELRKGDYSTLNIYF